MGIDHLVLRVSDMDRSRAFYGRLFDFLGFELHADYGRMVGWWNRRTRFYIAEVDKACRDEPYRWGAAGFHHYAFELATQSDVYELDRFLRHDLGGEIVDGAAEHYPNYHAVFFLDPDGMKLEGMKYQDH